MAQDMKIRELMDVPATQHDLDWLKKSLQAAIKLEFATLPPYLCAEWSVKSGLDPIRRSIHVIVQEEMVHLGLMSNMLTITAEVRSRLHDNAEPASIGLGRWRSKFIERRNHDHVFTAGNGRGLNGDSDPIGGRQLRALFSTCSCALKKKLWLAFRLAYPPK